MLRTFGSLRAEPDRPGRHLWTHCGTRTRLKLITEGLLHYHDRLYTKRSQTQLPRTRLRYIFSHVPAESRQRSLTRQLRENIFEKKYAECLIAKQGEQGDESGETIGMALVRGRISL